MAGIALAAIVQDRAAAEREARRRAEELLQQLGNGFERAMGFQLSQFQLGAEGGYARLWSKRHVTEAALWPGSDWRREAEKEWQTLAGAFAEADLAYEELARAGLRPEESVLSELAFAPDGEVTTPPDEAREPQPPQWRLDLTVEQLHALKELDELDTSSTNAGQVNAALKQFIDASPPGAALANAEFIRLRLLLAAESPTNAVRHWLELAQRCAGELVRGGLFVKQGRLTEHMSESGVPLSNLAVAKALQRAREVGPTEALWTALVREVGSVPSSFTPMLLDLAEPLTQARPDLQAALRALRLRWAATERAWEAADVIRCSGRLHGITTTNFWLDFQGARWLCLLQPGQSWQGTGPNAVTNWFTQARLSPKAAVELALRKVVQDSKATLPAYLRLSAELEGEALSLDSTSEQAGGRPAPVVTLAQTEGRLRCPATLDIRMAPPAESQPTSAGARATPRIESAGVPFENRFTPANHPVEFESMPSRPRFALRIELADRAALFAAQRRRTWLFGTLVLAAALTAAVGFGAAYRSFRRQLRLSEMKSNFVSSVSHELRAPIASVRLMAESLERGKIIEAPKQQEYFRFIGQECRRLSSLIENVLDFSRIEQGRKQYEFEPTDLLKLTQQTVKLMETYAAERGVTLALQFSDPQPSTLNSQPSVDAKALQQVLINLIDNALKHSPKGGTVTVGLEVEPRHPASSILLWVEDNGPGIPASEHEKIFERFYRLGSELRRETQGVGIGLSIVKHVVEAHGGQVRVRSAVGEGSRFTIELPASPDGMNSEGRKPKAE